MEPLLLRMLHIHNLQTLCLQNAVAELVSFLEHEPPDQSAEGVLVYSPGEFGLVFVAVLGLSMQRGC